MVALVGVAVGSLPPWLATNPWYDGVALTVYYAGQGSGLETWGMATLPLSVLAVGVLVGRDGRGARTSAALVGAGAAAVALDVAVHGVDVPWLLPGPGAVLTAVSGVVVLALLARSGVDPDR